MEDEIILCDIDANSSERLDIFNHLNLKTSNTFNYSDDSVICLTLTLVQKDLEQNEAGLIKKLDNIIHFSKFGHRALADKGHYDIHPIQAILVILVRHEI